MSATGLILQLMYRLRRHFWLGWPLARWLGLLLIVAVPAALILRQPARWPVAVLGVLLLGTMPGRIHPSCFLAVGQWPDHELGWSYIFFQPARGSVVLSVGA